MQSNARAATPRTPTPRAPSCPVGGRKPLGGTGLSLVSTVLGGERDSLSCGTPRSAPQSARTTSRPRRGGFAGEEHEEQDPWTAHIAAAEAQFMSAQEKELVVARRTNYPKKKVEAPPKIDPVTGEVDDTIARRVAGFNLNFDKVFATTSITLPVVAHCVFVELHTAHDKQIYSRRFSGLNTVFDMKKWIFEKLLVPESAYDLSYAEPGKAALPDELRLLTTQDSLDARTLAMTKAVQSMYRGSPGVHSIFDHGVTRLYARMKCRTCGDLLNSLQLCRKFKSFGEIEKQPYTDVVDPRRASASSPAAKKTLLKMWQGRDDEDNKIAAGVPGKDPAIEDCWYRPDEKKHCLFHSRGFELYQAARTHSGGAEFARLYLTGGKEPSKKLGLFESIPLTTRATKISY